MGLFSRSISPPPNAAPETLLRWASSFRGLKWPVLLPIVRGQAAIADWPSATFTLVKMQEAPLGEWGTEESRDHAIEATRWMLNQIQQGLDPLEPPDYVHRDHGPPPKPFPVSRAGSGIIKEGSSDKAASEGRFEEALSLARNYVRGPAETPRYAGPYCVIAKYQIIHGEIEGARRTLGEAYEVALNAPKSNFAVGRPRDENLGGVATLLADTGDFQRAERVFKMVKSSKDNAAYDFAVCYARNNDPSNAVRMLLNIRDDETRAKACVDVVRMLIDEPRGQTKWPYSSGLIFTLYDYAMATSSGAGGLNS